MDAEMTTPVSGPWAQAAPGIEMAGFMRRSVAYGIDMIVLGVANSLVGVILGSAPPSAASSSSLSRTGVDLTGLWIAVYMLIPVAIPALYFVWAYSSGGQTVGKALMGIKVVSIDGSPLTWSKALLRTIGYVPSSLVFGLGFLWAIWDKNKQSWHDKIAGTMVVRASVPQEALVGRVDPDAARRSRQVWLIALGALTAVGLIAFGASVFAGSSEVREMGPWPDREVQPEQVADVDLTHLGLTRTEITNARAAKKWSAGTYRVGAMTVYTAEQQPAVSITALRYSDTATASNEFGSVEEWAKNNCRLSTYVNLVNTGVVRCNVTGAHARTLWSGYWILDIIALDRGQVSGQQLADKVRDAVAANWKRTGE